MVEHCLEDLDKLPPLDILVHTLTMQIMYGPYQQMLGPELGLLL